MKCTNYDGTSGEASGLDRRKNCFLPDFVFSMRLEPNGAKPVDEEEDTSCAKTKKTLLFKGNVCVQVAVQRSSKIGTSISCQITAASKVHEGQTAEQRASQGRGSRQFLWAVEPRLYTHTRYESICRRNPKGGKRKNPYPLANADWRMPCKKGEDAAILATTQQLCGDDGVFIYLLHSWICNCAFACSCVHLT